MRPRAIQNVPGLDPNAIPFKRLTEFARIIIQIPKTEADKSIEMPCFVRPMAVPRKKAK